MITLTPETMLNLSIYLIAGGIVVFSILYAVAIWLGERC